MNLIQLENMINDVSKMNNFEQNHVYKILNNCGVKLSENSNGYFVSLRDLSQETIDKLLDYTKQCNASKKEAKKNAISFSKIEKKLVSKKSDQPNDEWKQSMITDLQQKKKKKPKSKDT